MRLKTFCACLALVTYAGTAMDGPAHTEARDPADKGKATVEKKNVPIGQADLENLPKEELLKIIADLQQQIKTHESALAKALDQTIHTKDEKVLEKEYDQLVEAVKSGDEEKIKDPRNP